MARILVVDDSFVARKSLGKQLLELGHKVVGEAENGIEAVSKYKPLMPDIVMMDLAMPEKDGIDAIVEILSLHPEAIIVVVSARQDRDVVINALDKGARHFINKPFTKEMLDTVLKNVLEQKLSDADKKARLNSLKLAYSREEAKNTPVKVLIVDDSVVARKCLREIVTSLGHVVVGEAENGAQAFVEYMKHKPDVVTMDLTMQGLGGAEATSKIIAADTKAKIIVISAMEARLAIIDALERGARHFIIKPIKEDNVAAAFNNVLRQNFSIDDHLERVRKLKEFTISTAQAAAKIVPPYQINLDDSGMAHVMVNDSITLTSFKSLSLELAEFYGDGQRILLDFGVIAHLPKALVLEFNNLIKVIEDSNAAVKAITRSERLKHSICELSTKEYNYLKDILRVY